MRLRLLALAEISFAISAVMFGYFGLLLSGMIYRLGPIEAVNAVFSFWQLPLFLGGSLVIGAVFLRVGITTLRRLPKA